MNSSSGDDKSIKEGKKPATKKTCDTDSNHLESNDSEDSANGKESKDNEEEEEEEDDEEGHEDEDVGRTCSRLEMGSKGPKRVTMTWLLG